MGSFESHSAQHFLAIRPEQHKQALMLRLLYQHVTYRRYKRFFII